MFFVLHHVVGIMFKFLKDICIITLHNMRIEFSSILIYFFQLIRLLVFYWMVKLLNCRVNVRSSLTNCYLILIKTLKEFFVRVMKKIEFEKNIPNSNYELFRILLI